MPRKGHSEEQIVYALRQIEGGKKVSEICREMVEAAVRGIGLARGARASATAGRESQAEGDRGGPHVGQTHSARGALKKGLKPVKRRELVREIRQAYQLNESRACGLVRITRWSNRYESRRDPQSELRVRLRDLASTRIRYGYRRLTVLLRREGWLVNTKRVYRLYREEGLELRMKKRGKRVAQARIRLAEAYYPNQRWSMDFVSDRLVDGRWFRILTVVDQYTRECLCAHADRSQSGEKVSEQLQRVITQRGAPESITSDNGSEFAGQAMDYWAHQVGVQLDFIRPGKPVENSYIESFNGRLRDECLNVEVFLDLADAQWKIEQWRRDYNQQRPHSALADRTPQEFAFAATQLSFGLSAAERPKDLTQDIVCVEELK
jgi:putative transposase